MGVKESLDFSGKVVVVTGGASGMGTGLAKSFAEVGADVVFTYLKHGDESEKIMEMLKSFGGRSHAICMDQSIVEQCESMVDEVVQKMGRIDVLINNSGLHGSTESLDIERDDWDTMLNTNLRGSYFCAQYVAKQMIKQGNGGSIISISSINSFIPLRKSTHYGVSKAGMNMFTRSLAAELGEFGIRVNAIAAGLIESPALDVFVPGWRERYIERSPLGKTGLPSDIGNICIFLASPMSAWITGQTIVADGGVLLAPAF